MKFLSVRNYSLAVAVMIVVVFSQAYGQSTAFTYQGRLNDGSSPASGTYHLEFLLFDSPTGGTQIGPTLSYDGIGSNPTVLVANGFFTVELNFGNQFPGGDRYLEIRAKKPVDAVYSTLAPRQRLTATPYSLRSLSAVSADAVNPSAGNSVITAINAGSSTLDAARLPSTLATQNGTNIFSGTNTFSTSPTFSAGLSTNGQRITGVGTPTAATDATSKAYVDSVSPAPGSLVQLAPPARQTTSSINHLISLKLVSTDPVNHKLGTPGVNSLLSLSASGTYQDNSVHDKERFRIDNDGSILAVGDYTGGINTTSPAEGSGTRFMWYATKAALRAGQIDGTQWDDANIGLHSVAFGQNVRALGDNSIAVGKSTVAANTGTVGLGEGHTVTGANSIALGYGASTSTAAGSPRLGTFVFADRSTATTCPLYISGSTVDSNCQFHPTVTNSFNVRAVNGSFFYTNTAQTTGFIFNSTTSTMTLTNSKLTMASDGSTTLTSNPGGSAGVFLPAGGGAWNNLSDRNAKENFSAVSPRAILRGVLSLPISTWNYKSQGASIRHMGPMAQDFFTTFRIGEGDKTIATIDPDGVALAAIQGLSEELKDRDQKIDAQQRELNSLRQQVDQQRIAIEQLKQVVCSANASAVICRK